MRHMVFHDCDFSHHYSDFVESPHCFPFFCFCEPTLCCFRCVGVCLLQWAGRTGNQWKLENQALGSPKTTAAISITFRSSWCKAQLSEIRGSLRYTLLTAGMRANGVHWQCVLHNTQPVRVRIVLYILINAVKKSSHACSADAASCVGHIFFSQLLQHLRLLPGNIVLLSNVRMSCTRQKRLPLVLLTVRES